MRSCVRAPEGTFGRAYADFMRHRRFQANERPPVRFIGDPDVAYVATRYRQVHDLWHVLFDCHTNMVGETALKALEFAQVRGCRHSIDKLTCLCCDGLKSKLPLV